MCGIAGVVQTYTPGCEQQGRQVLQTMLRALAHRGPDGEGSWSTRLGNTLVGLGNRRLAIIDLSDGGRQPMLSQHGRYVLVYNGEIYNYLELRSELESKGCVFRSQSDTEVVLEALITWGIEAFSRFNGMWALAFLDTQRNTILLSRDRFGIKPLYLYQDKNALYFASEIKAICAGLKHKFPVNTIAVARFLQQSLLDAQSDTFFAGITQLPSGHYVEIHFGDTEGIHISQPKPFWNLPDKEIQVQNEQELLEHVRNLFLNAVSIRLRSDVPVGVLLSGGVDSSSIVAAIHTLHVSNPPSVISVVSDDPQTSEEPFIDLVSNAFGLKVEKIRLRPNPQDAFQAFERATWASDEPLGGFSYVALYLLMERAKELGITVLLGGQGGDETLCGYRKYQVFYLQQLAQEKRYFALARSFAATLWPTNGFLSDFNLSDARRYLPKVLHFSATNILGPALEESNWLLPLGAGENGVIKRQMLDIYRYSIPALTHYEDRMSSAFGREVRLPFLDYRLVSLLVPLPPEWKIRDGWTKWIFRKAMERLLPKQIVWRRDKKGFTTPIGEWLRREWRPRVSALFEKDDMLTVKWGLVNREKLLKLYNAYCSGAFGLGARDVFLPLALEIWARQFQEYLSCP